MEETASALSPGHQMLPIQKTRKGLKQEVATNEQNGVEARASGDQAVSWRLDETERYLIRRVNMRSGTTVDTRVALPRGFDRKQENRLPSIWDQLVLSTTPEAATIPDANPVRVVDLFAGCGAMSFGVRQACLALGRRFDLALAVDSWRTATRVLSRNLASNRTVVADMAVLLPGALGVEPTDDEIRFADALGDVEILVGGPPCQGHSNLNNHTRRSDPKNALYSRMARFAELVQPEHVVIENVPAVTHDSGGIVSQVQESLVNSGYQVDSGVVELRRLGVPQMRRRHVLLASRTITPDLAACVEEHAVEERDVRWALSNLKADMGLCSQVSTMSEKNTLRSNYLYDNGLYDLPNELRPDCHRLNPSHTYKSVYGRLRWDRPAPTITRGFTSMGQGRFLHPSERRTLTPREAARLQMIPDVFDFNWALNRTAIAELIANAVPPKLSYVMSLELLR